MSRLALALALLSFSALGFAAEAPSLHFAELGDFALASGEVLFDGRLGYRTAGTLDSSKSNAVLFPTWFTGTTEQLFLSGRTGAVDTSKFFLIAVDAFGNGVSSSPSNSVRQKGETFPPIAIRDMVNAQYRLVTEVLGIPRLHAVMGISMGGMQTFEWITAYPDAMEKAVSIVGSPRLGSYDLLLWSTQLEAIALAVATGEPERAKRLVDLISTLALQTPGFHSRETDRVEAIGIVERAGSPMDIHDRAVQLRAMIGHDVSKSFDGSMEKAASAVKAEVLNVVGLKDHMVTPGPALEFAELIGAGSISLESDCGHLAFGCDATRLDAAIRAFLERGR
jgi:homoserine O-acetyltransferase